MFLNNKSLKYLLLLPLYVTAIVYCITYLIFIKILLHLVNGFVYDSDTK